MSVKVAKPRIGDGSVSLIIMVLALLGGGFCAMAAVGGAPEAGPIAALAFLVAGGCAALFFWRKMFAAIEARLIDIEVALKAPALGSVEGGDAPKS